MRFDVRWIADYRDETHLSVQYCPVFDGLGKIVADSLHTPLQQRPFPPEVSGDLNVLVGLVAALAETEIEPVEGVEWTIQPHVLERTVTDSYGGRRDSFWLRFDFFLTHPLGMHDRRWHEWKREDATGEIASIVSRLDEYANMTAGSHWADHYNEFAQREEIDSFLPGPVGVFLSYRAQSEEVIELASRK